MFSDIYDLTIQEKFIKNQKPGIKYGGTTCNKPIDTTLLFIGIITVIPYSIKDLCYLDSYEKVMAYELCYFYLGAIIKAYFEEQLYENIEHFNDDIPLLHFDSNLEDEKTFINFP